MNNEIHVSHSNGVTVYYTEGSLDNDNEWLFRRRKVTIALVGVVALAVTILDGRLVPVLLGILAIAVTAGLTFLMGRAIYRAGKRHRQAQAAIAARADVQHAALLQGDMEVGLFGIYPPAIKGQQ